MAITYFLKHYFALDVDIFKDMNNRFDIFDMQKSKDFKRIILGRSTIY